MGIQSASLFDPDGKPTYVLIAQVHAKAPAKPLEANLAAIADSEATTYFRGWWNAAFPARNPLPDEALANPDGTGTLAFWRVFT